MQPRFAAAAAGAPYTGLAAELVRRTKYGHDRLLALPLAALTRRAARSLPDRAWVDDVVPVPASPRRRRERGFDLAELLADDLARVLRVPLRRGWLARVGDPSPQAALGETERRRAARGTVAYDGPGCSRRLLRRRRGAKGRRVLLVDDVLTTGATANACTAALLDAGADWVVVVVAARA